MGVVEELVNTDKFVVETEQGTKAVTFEKIKENIDDDFVTQEELEETVSQLQDSIDEETERATQAEQGKVDKVEGMGLSHNDFTNAYKQQINTNKEDIVDINRDLEDKVDKIQGKGLSTNDFTNEYKDKVDTNAEDIEDLDTNKVDKVAGKGLSTNDYDNTAKDIVDNVTANLGNKVDKVIGKGLSTNDFTDAEKEKLDNLDPEEMGKIDDVKVNGQSVVQNKVANVDLTSYSLISETGKKITLEMNSSTYELTAKLYDKNNNLISTSNVIDLPIEQLVVSISYDSTTKELVITLKNGTSTRVPLSSIISNLASETYVDGAVDTLKQWVVAQAYASDADLDAHTGNTTVHVTAQDKTNWNGKATPQDISNHNTSNSAHQDIREAIDGKVDKVTGKGLSTNDFTTALKTKLDNLENYDDTEVKQDIEDLDEAKVDKETGKGLSTNDFTNAYKNKVDGAVQIDAGDFKIGKDAGGIYILEE